MPYAWAIGLVYFGLDGNIAAVITWCVLFVFGAWLVEAGKPLCRLAIEYDQYLHGDRTEPPAEIFAVELVLVAASSNAELQPRTEAGESLPE